MFQLAQLAAPGMRRAALGAHHQRRLTARVQGRARARALLRRQGGRCRLHARLRRRNLRADGVLVNAIAPGLVDTRLNEGLTPEWKAAKLRRDSARPHRPPADDRARRRCCWPPRRRLLRRADTLAERRRCLSVSASNGELSASARGRDPEDHNQSSERRSYPCDGRVRAHRSCGGRAVAGARARRSRHRPA